MSAADEPAPVAEQDSPDGTAEPPVAPAVPAEPAPRSDDDGPADEPGEQANLVDDALADVPFEGEPGRRDHHASGDWRSVGVDPDGHVRTRRPLRSQEEARTSTGDKVAYGHYATSIENLYQMSAAEPSRVHAGQVAPALVQSVVDTQILTADHDALRDTLLRYGVVYLSGADGCGRMSGAYAVLAALCGVDKVIGYVLDDKADLTDVLTREDLPRTGHGHVVELPAGQPAPRIHTLTAVGGQFTGKSAYLVVIGPPAATEHALHPYEVPHHPPPAADVLNSHLTHELGLRTNWSDGQVATFVATCRHSPGIAERLRGAGQPAAVVHLARRLVQVGLRGGQPDEALTLLPNALRKLAVDVLRHANEEGGVHPLRVLTARIAYGLFSERPLAVVFELASRLFAELPQEEETPPGEPSRLVRTVFDGGMESLIDDRMRAGHAAGDDDRLARLVDPELALAVLDVVWHDYDHLRGPLVDWLFLLGGDARPQVSARAARLTGQLALFDFGTIYRELLRPLARSRNKTHRQSAALALERAVLEPKLAARVCRQVQDWTFSPDRYLNDTAARCYATRLGAEFADEPLAHLAWVALQSEQVVSPAVAVAVAELHQPDDPESGHAILTELAHWTEDRTRSLHVHAARATTLLARRTAPPPADRWPALLHHAAGSGEARELLLGLWRATLTEPMVAARGWQTLLLWLLRPDRTDELHEFTVAFATELLRTRELRSRAFFHLSQWLPLHPDAQTLHQVRDDLRKENP